VLVGDGAAVADVERCRLAAKVAGVAVIVSRDEADVLGRIAEIRPSKVRVLGAASDAVFVRCDELGIPIDDAPVTPIGRLELLHWTREQTVSETRHRYGNVRR
jgi:RHH-type proline utilization regulon transcriptional repressor/proline dehydrogenase/delta 1-pyrroline-5-carboxylate dehydrogenase